MHLENPGDLNTLRTLNRRRFLSGIGLAGAAIAGSSLLTGCSDTAPTIVNAAGVSELDVLNFALNLEYLEATLYSFLVTGADLATSLTGINNKVNGTVMNPPPKLTTANVSQQTLNILAAVYYDEASHVADLIAAIGPDNVASRPNLSFTGVTATNALAVARLAEEIGATAYAGAGPLLTGANLQAASQILAVEGFHAGALRLLCIQQNIAYPTNLKPADNYDIPPSDPGQTQNLAGALQTGGVFATASGATTSQTNTQPGFAYRRTTSQVLAAVYGNATAGTSSGGFFPNGFNGNIKAV